MARIKTVLAYGVSNLLVDYNTCAKYTLNSDHKGEWPLAFYLLEDGFFGYNVLRYLPISINLDNFAIVPETH